MSTLDLDDGQEVELTYAPNDYNDPIIKINGDYMVIGYLADDEDPLDPFEEFEGQGVFYSASRNAGKDEHRGMQDALGLDGYWSPDLDLVDSELLVKAFQARLTFDFNNQVSNQLYDEAFKSLKYQYNDDAFNQAIDQHKWTANIFQEINAHFDTVEAIDALEHDSLPAANIIEVLKQDAWLIGKKEGTIGNPCAVTLDCYSHSGEVWAISNSSESRSFPDQQFDVSHGAGVWVPDNEALISLNAEVAKRLGSEVLIKECAAVAVDPALSRGWTLEVIDKQSQEAKVFHDWKSAGDFAISQVKASPEFFQTLRQVANEYARSALETKNSLSAGDVYGVCVDSFIRENEESEWTMVDDDACWGFIGNDHAKASLIENVEYTFNASFAEGFIEKKKADEFTGALGPI